MSNIHYFKTRKDAEDFLNLLYGIKTYELSYNECSRPSYKIVKVVNQIQWKIRMTQYFYGPKELKTWITTEMYLNMIDYKKAMNIDDEKETRVENLAPGGDWYVNDH